MAKVSADEAFKRYRSGMSNAGERIKYGVQNTDKSQSENAIAAKDRMKENWQKAMDKGKWESGLKKSGDDKWANNLVEKGIGKIVNGIDTNESEIKQTFVKVVECGSRVSNAVDGMAKGGTENAVARARKAIETSKAYWGKD